MGDNSTTPTYRTMKLGFAFLAFLAIVVVATAGEADWQEDPDVSPHHSTYAQVTELYDSMLQKPWDGPSMCKFRPSPSSPSRDIPCRRLKKEKKEKAKWKFHARKKMNAPCKVAWCKGGNTRRRRAHPMPHTSHGSNSGYGQNTTPTKYHGDHGRRRSSGSGRRRSSGSGPSCCGSEAGGGSNKKKGGKRL